MCDSISATYSRGADMVVLINTSDVLDGKFLNRERVPNKDLKGQFKKTFKRDDILYSEIRPANKRFAYVDFDAIDYIASTKLMVLRAKSNVNPRFLYHILKSEDTLEKLQMLAESRSGTFPQITYSEMANVSVLLPDRATQDKIVAILSSLDDKIENNNRINRNLEAQAQALFKSWFVDFEPWGGTMPEDWREYELGEFLPVITGKKDANIASKTGTYPFFSCAQDILYTDNYSFDADAILVAGNGDFNVKWYRGKFEAYQRTYVLIPNNSRYLGWLFYMVKHNLNNITCGARGSVIKFITKGNLENFRFAAPMDLTNCDIIDKFNTINQTIENNRGESARLAALRDTLLPKLMKGEIEL